MHGKSMVRAFVQKLGIFIKKIENCFEKKIQNTVRLAIF